jgi:hypothetical protein
VAIDDEILGPDDGREYVQSHHAGDDQDKKSFHSLLRSLWPRRAVDDAADMGARGQSIYEAIQRPVVDRKIARLKFRLRSALRYANVDTYNICPLASLPSCFAQSSPLLLLASRCFPSSPPRFDWADPKTLLVEDDYQRRLTQRSVTLIH